MSTDDKIWKTWDGKHIKNNFLFSKSKGDKHFFFFMHTMDLASYIFYILDFDKKKLDL